MKEKNKNKKKESLTAFSIIMIVLALVCASSLFIKGAKINDDIILELNKDKFAELINQVESGNPVRVKSAQISDFIMAIPRGFIDAADLIFFIIAVGGFIELMMKTGALEAGINRLITKMQGSENKLIITLMSLFSLGGTTYGMGEEAIGFYPLLTTTMVAAGFDSLVGIATILWGCTAGTMGSTLNPFSAGAAMSALSSVGIEPDTNLVMLVGAIIWLVTIIVAIVFVNRYAKKLLKDKSKSALTDQELELMHKSFDNKNDDDVEFNKKHKRVLFVFAIGFAIMILSLISYEDLFFAGNREGFEKFFSWTRFLTGEYFGKWYFKDLGAWFIVMSVGVSLVAGLSEKEFMNNFIKGAQGIISVGLILAIARGVSIVMADTHMDFYILDRASKLLSGMPGFVFVPLSYIIFMFVGILVPSSSGLAALSIPVMGPLASALGFNPNIMIGIFTAGLGSTLLLAPTSPMLMAGLELSKIEYGSYLKWAIKYVITIAIIHIIILSIAIYIL